MLLCPWHWRSPRRLPSLSSPTPKMLLLPLPPNKVPQYRHKKNQSDHGEQGLKEVGPFRSRSVLRQVRCAVDSGSRPSVPTYKLKCSPVSRALSFS